MAKGLDTSFLVQCELAEHPVHRRALDLLTQLVTVQERLALAPQVVSEFVHIVTDPGRFAHPLGMPEAVARAERWWNGQTTWQVFPNEASTLLFLDWMQQHRLGRKRLLDTQLAATYRCAGVRALVTSNPNDFEIFGCFEIVKV